MHEDYVYFNRIRFEVEWNENINVSMWANKAANFEDVLKRNRKESLEKNKTTG